MKDEILKFIGSNKNSFLKMKEKTGLEQLGNMMMFQKHYNTKTKSLYRAVCDFVQKVSNKHSVYKQNIEYITTSNEVWELVVNLAFYEFGNFLKNTTQINPEYLGKFTKAPEYIFDTLLGCSLLVENLVETYFTPENILKYINHEIGENFTFGKIKEKHSIINVYETDDGLVQIDNFFVNEDYVYLVITRLGKLTMPDTSNNKFNISYSTKKEKIQSYGKKINKKNIQTIPFEKFNEYFLEMFPEYAI